MMAMVNKIFLLGNLTKDPVLRVTSNNHSVANFALAVNKKIEKEGEVKHDVFYIDVSCWRVQAENVCKYLKKGSLIHLEGELVFKSWKTDKGETRHRHEVLASNIQFLGGGSKEDS